MVELKKQENISGKEQQRGTERNPTRTSAIEYDYIMNGYDLSPNYIQHIVSKQKIGAIGAGGYGAFKFQENVKPLPIKRLFPHLHDRNEYFIFYSTDPEKPDDIGGTVEFWIGAGDDAEPFMITKPTIVTLPPGTVHLPEAFRGYHGINAASVIYDAPLWQVEEVEELPPDFSPIKKVSMDKFKDRKYQDLVNEQDISRAAVFPSHKGKAQVILHYDMLQNKYATHYMEANLISGSGIGWGCGDMMQFPKYRIRSFPHLHAALETYCFLGTDPDNPNDLGGTLEFWIGEGEKAKKIEINKPAVMLIPPNTVHLPMYVHEVHNPFITMAILDTPLWSVYYSDEFPPAFEHVSTPADAVPMQFNLIYNKEKCTYPKCHICADQCQVQGIDLSAEPPVVGDPCLACGQCAVLCPQGAIQVEVK